MFGQDQDENQMGGGPTDNGSGSAPVIQPTVSSHTGASYDGTNTSVPSDPSVANPVVSPTFTPPVAPATDDLAEIKQKALHQLMPVVDKLDQSPEEKFRTTMMIIQASDNRALVKTAYEAAMQISDEKERAMALVSVVNEINYFSQNDAKQAESQAQ
jgi:DhnA family fructose-bisphosphate aldolase class Ia